MAEVRERFAPILRDPTVATLKLRIVSVFNACIG